MDDPLPVHLEAARRLLDGPLPESAVELTELLTQAREHITAALDETMARAALGGTSLRAIAASAQVAPNSVPPRLARSAVLGSYAKGGKVSAEDLAVARADQAGRPADNDPPAQSAFTFTPRRRTAP